MRTGKNFLRCCKNIFNKGVCNGGILLLIVLANFFFSPSLNAFAQQVSDSKDVEIIKDEIELFEHTKVITDEKALEQLTFADNEKLIFSKERPQLQALGPGNVIIINKQSKVLPYGTLRKVKDIIRHDNHFEIITEPASLTDAIKKAHIIANVKVTNREPQKTTGAIDLAVKCGRTPSTDLTDTCTDDRYCATFGITDTCTIDAVIKDTNDTPNNEDDDKEILSGTVTQTVGLNLYFEIEIDVPNSLYYFKLRPTGTSDTTLELTLPISDMDKKYEKEWKIIEGPPIPLSVITLHPVLYLVGGISGEVGTEITTTVTANANLAGEFWWKYDKGVQTLNSSGNWAFGFKEPTVSLAGTVSAEAFVGPKLALLAYGMLGPYISGKEVLEFEGKAALSSSGSSSVNWSLSNYGKVDGGVKFDLSIGNWIELLRIDFSIRLWESERWIIASSTNALTVTTSGPGTVTSSPEGISCGTDCSEAYNYNPDSDTEVTLTATPDSHATFAGWSGACTGAQTTCTLTMDANKSVTATFTRPLTITLTPPCNTTVSQGGRVGPFSAYVTNNNKNSNFSFYFYTSLGSPEGKWATLTPIPVSIAAGETFAHEGFYDVPSTAQLGTHTHYSVADDANGNRLDADSFTFTVEQAGTNCTYSISPTSQASFGTEGSGYVNVTAGAGCSWTAESNVSNTSWLTITSCSNGNGNGIVYYSIAANYSGSKRMGTMTIAGKTFTVTQDVFSCTYSINPTSYTFDYSSAGTSSVSVTAPAGCAWTATSNADWITITSGSSGSGDGIVYYSISANTGASTRMGTITIAGQTFTVTQPGISDTTPPTGSISINGGSTYTNSTSVTLTLSASDSDGVSQMCISNSSTCSSWETYATSKTWTLTSGDGTKNVYVWFKDSAGNQNTSPYSDTITLDTTAPTGSVSINSNATTTNTTSVTLTISASDSTSGVYQMCISNTSICSSWEAYATSKSWTLTSGDGTKTVYAWFKDNAGNANTSPYSDNITLSSGGSLSITVNNVSGSSYQIGSNGNVKLYDSNWNLQTEKTTSSNTASFSGLSAGNYYYEVYNNSPSGFGTEYWGYKGASITAGSSTSSTFTRYLPYGASVNFYDANGNAIAGSISPNTQVTAKVTIKNDDSGYSYPVTVELMIDRDKISSYDYDQTSSSQTVSSGSSKTYSFTYTPSSTGTYYYTIKVKSSLANGNMTYTDLWSWTNGFTVSDSKPTVSITSPTNNSSVSKGTVSISVSATDDIGIQKIQVWTLDASYSDNKTFSGSNKTETATFTWNTSSYASGSNQTLYARAYDTSGNYSDTSIAVLIETTDTTAPTGSINIMNGASYATNTLVSLNLTCDDGSNGSGCKYMQFANDTCPTNDVDWSTKESFNTTKSSWVLSTGDGTKKVCVRFEDGVGLKSGSYSDTIILDTAAPTNGTLTATPSSGQVSLSWSGFSDPTSGIGSYKLVYSTSSTPSSCSSGTQIYSGTNTSYTHTGLTNGTTYYYRVCATDNAGNTSTGATASATPQTSSSTKPTATTNSATSVSSSLATLNGTVNPNGTSTTAYFQYGTTTSYGSTTSSQSIGSGTSNVSVTANLSGLSSGTTYHYRVVATNSAGTSYGSDITFTTSSASISGQVTSGGSGLSGVTMNLWSSGGSKSQTTTTDSSGNYTFNNVSNGTWDVEVSVTGYTCNTSCRQTVTVNGANVTGINFALTKVTSFSISGQVTSSGSGLSGVTMNLWSSGGSKSQTTTTDSSGNYTFNNVSNGTWDVEVSVTGYTCNTSCRQTVTVNSSNLTGVDFTLASTATKPTATTNSATSVSSNSATLNATVNPNGSSTTAYFQYGTTTSYGSSTSSQSIGSGTSNTSVTANLSGLSSSSTYHYRIVAANSAGTTYGSDISFTTTACTYSFATLSTTFNSAGGTGTVNVNAGSGCSWSATSNVSWITITSGSGTGNGSISYSVDAYTGSTSRTGILTLTGGATYTVMQNPPDQTYTITYVSPINCETVSKSGFYFKFTPGFSGNGQISVHSGSVASSSNMVSSSSSFTFTANTTKSVYAGSAFYPQISTLASGTYYWVVCTSSQCYTPAQCFKTQ
jgi:hypothetical protein